jgi:GT2 family glycosyltransferase
MLRTPTRVSVIVPVHNGAAHLRECLPALRDSAPAAWEILVVDDASTDETFTVALEMGARVLRLAERSGPAAARNWGARYARGDVLFFVDADVVVAPRALHRIARWFREQPDLGAVFGSYDASPREEDLVSQYRNLLHHFVHQNGHAEASTFWAGCGAIRRAVFEELGGFDEERFPDPSIEDVELGYRLRRAGHRILLDKDLQATHLKRWTLRSVLHTDIKARAVPWSRLILESGKAPDDLNLKGGQRFCVALVMLAGMLLPLALAHPYLLPLPGGPLLLAALLNLGLYRFFARQRGVLFAAACVPLHLLYYLYGGLAFLYVWLDLRVGRRLRLAPVLSGEERA